MKNLLYDGMGQVVQPTSLTRKLTIEGVTKAYPVYRVRLDQLFYNDQNDRIATWISQFKNEHGEQAFAELDTDVVFKLYPDAKRILSRPFRKL